MKGGPKQTQTVQQANTYAWQQTPSTQEIEDFKKWTPQIDPAIGYRYGQAENAIRDTYDNPLGAYETAQTRGAGLRANIKGLNQEKGEAFREAYGGVNAQRMGQLGMLAELTAPRLVQSGGTQTGTTQQSNNLLGPLIGAASSVGAAAL
jgi:hypothetical protein